MAMDRTPIKIPGKRNGHSSKAALAAGKAVNPSTSKMSQSSQAALEEQHAYNKNKSSSKKRSLKNIKSRHKMSHLEKLPTELLTEIFLYSMNMDLPRSSPVIGGRLASQLIYTRTVIAAFGPTWKEGYGYCRNSDWNMDISDAFPPLMASKQDDIGDGELQSAVLRCHWASLSVIQKSQEVWIAKLGENRPFIPLSSVADIDMCVEAELQKKRFQRQLKPADYFDEEFDAFSDYFRGQNRAWGVKVHWTTYVNVARGLEIPESLLLGPWTEEMRRMLYWLVKGGAKLNWLTSTSGEAAMLGLKTAVGEGDVRVVHLLFWAGLTERIDGEMIPWVINNARLDRLNMILEVYKLWLRPCRYKRHRRDLVDEALEDIVKDLKTSDEMESREYAEMLEQYKEFGPRVYQ